jgi:hypothetical protein
VSEPETRVICPTCGGAGRLVVGQCMAIVGTGTKRRQCTQPARSQEANPSYYAFHEDRLWIQVYCGLHGNRAIRESVRRRPEETG